MSLAPQQNAAESAEPRFQLLWDNVLVAGTTIESILGVNIAAGVAYLVLIRRPGAPSFEAPIKFPLSANADDFGALLKLGERFAAEARAHNVVCVAFAEPKKYQGWGYRAAYARAAPQIAAGLALRSIDVELRVVPQITAASSLGAKLGTLEDVLAARFPESESVVHWADRVPALSVGLHVADELWS